MIRNLGAFLVLAVLMCSVHHPVLAADRFVAAGGALQAALDAALPGDTITLQAGAQFSGNFIVRNKGASSEWITIQSSSMMNLPAGARVTPASASSMPKLVSASDAPVLLFETGANHVRLYGLEIAAKPGVYNWALIVLGTGNSWEKSISDLPSDVTIDRCWIHGDPTVGSRRGIALNSVNTKVLNSWFEGFMSTVHDTQAIGGWTGPGPYEITNNHLEATGEAVAFGGAIPSVAGVIPSDISIRRNHFYKPLSWRGSQWNVKNHLEFKMGRRVTVDGNVFENIWAASQAGYAVQLTVRTEQGQLPYSTIDTLTFTNNIVRGASGAINFLAKDDYNNGGSMRNVVVRNNLFIDINSSHWAGLGRLFQILNGPEGLTIDHNTSLQDGPMLVFDYSAAMNFSYTNNISPSNDGIIGGGLGAGLPTLTKFAPDSTFRRNVIAGGVQSMYPTDNYFPASLATVYFVDPTTGNYALRTDSPYTGTSTDGKPAGADVAAINTATANVVIAANAIQAASAPLSTPTPAQTSPAPKPTGPYVSGFTLINTDINQPVPGYSPIPNGAILDLPRLGVKNFNIRIDGSFAYSAQYVDDAFSRYEGVAPYSFGGDGGSFFYPWFLGAGTHTLKVIPNSGWGMSGISGNPYSITVQIIR